MQLATSTTPARETESKILAVGLFDGPTAPPESIEGTAAGDLVGRLLSAKDVGTGLGDVNPLPGASGLKAGTLVTFGLGSRDAFGPGAAYSAGVALSKKLAAKPREAVAVVVPDAGDPAAIASALTQGLIVGTRGPGLRKSEPNRHPFGTLTILGSGDPGALESAVRKGEVLGEAINLARDLANTPPDEKDPTTLARKAKEVAEAAGLEAEVWDADRLKAERFGGVLAVAAGSDQPPAFVIVRNPKARKDSPTLALIGKGVTFDSGGLSLKPSTSMEDMKCDMTGAAVVLAAMQAVGRLGLDAPVVGYFALTENMTGGRAMKLGDVLTMRNGKTVEVLNTDAEGRLILADVLSYAAEQKPARMLDLATLTGACMVALGTKIAGLFSTDDALATDVLAACKATGERAWRLPLDDDFGDLLKSQVADLKNIGGKFGGSITAAKFLQRFASEIPWAHLDIAGPAWVDGDSSTSDSGGSGCFVRTLVALIEAHK